jgi:signal transduction histidine kinase
MRPIAVSEPLDLSSDERSIMIESTDLLGDLPPDDITLLARVARPFRINAGETIVEEGEQNPLLGLIVEGSVKIAKQVDGQQRTITSIPAGRAFGEMSVIDDFPFSASVIAAEPCVVLLFTRADLEAVAAADPHVYFRVLTLLTRVITARLRRTTDTLAAYLTRTADLTESLNHALAQTRERSAFIAGMSHEMRTPLNAIIGYSELLQEDMASGECEGCVEDAQRIRNAGEHLMRLIGDVLDLSKIEAGRFTLDLETFELRSLIDDVIATAQPLAAKRGNVLGVVYDADPGMLYADATLLRQVLLNLLSNAAKFTDHGAITLKVQAPGADQIVLTVSDTGIGMSAEQLGKLFQSYVQADPGIRAEYGGTGLGLAISRSLCRTAGGDITVASTPGVGSTFTATLPRQFDSTATG